MKPGAKDLVGEALWACVQDHPHEEVVGLVFRASGAAATRYTCRLRYPSGWSRRTVLWTPPGPSASTLDEWSTCVGDDIYRWMLATVGGSLALFMDAGEQPPPIEAL